MDDLKKRGVAQFSNWHFINLPLCDDNSSLCESISVPDMLNGGDNLVWAINRAVTVIKSKAAGGFERGFALRNLIHLVGDIHQPLHCVARYSKETPLGDAGGNLFHIKNFHGVSNLHSLWDSGAGLFNNDMIRPLSNENISYIDHWAEKIIAQVNTSEVVDVSNITAWALESIELSKKYVYNLQYNSYPSDEYIQAAQEVIMHQIGVGGYRLAQLLRHIVWCNPSTNNCPIINPAVVPSPGGGGDGGDGDGTKQVDHIRVGYTVTATVLCAALAVSVMINAFFVYKRKAILSYNKPADEEHLIH
jgi:hypothetical protein